MPVMGYASEPLRLAIGLIGMIENRVLAFSARFAAVAFLLLSASLAAAADKVSKAQERAAGEFLAAAASGDPQAVAYAIHPTDLDALRTRILTKLREEAKNNDNTIRGRLFGPAMPLADLERLTSVGFYTTLARRLQLGGRPYREVDGIAALPDRDGAVLVVVRGKPPKERGTVSIVHVVALKPYGKDWKAVVPAQIEAQIEDLEEGRRSAPPPPPGAGPAGAKTPGTPATPAESGLPPAIAERVANAEKALAASRCDEYYDRYMSPNFRRVTSKKAREALISTCRNSSSNREMLLATVRIVKTLVPRFEYEGQRAVYDLSGQGLPYNRFVLEQVDKRWYIAE
jgi:hypothetical protein